MEKDERAIPVLNWNIGFFTFFGLFYNAANQFIVKGFDAHIQQALMAVNSVHLSILEYGLAAICILIR